MRLPTTSERRLPEGRLTLLFTDIEGSTELVKRFADRYAALQERHRDLLRAAFVAQDGFEVDTQGDAFFYVFRTAEAALRAALDAQRALAAEDWPDGGEVLVRMGLHAGTPTRTAEGYVGLDVNRAARIAGAAHGGQVLLSLATIEDVGDAAARWGVGLRDHGPQWLKGLDEGEHLYQAVDPDLPDIDTAPAALSQRELRRRIGVRHIVGVDPEDVAPRTVEALFDALEAAVLDSSTTVALSPAELAALARHDARTLREHRLGRIARWNEPRYELDDRFVELTLMVDQGEEAVAGRWAPRAARHADLREVLAESDGPALIVIGPPGSGKSTLLRRLEMDAAVAALQGEDGETGPVTFHVALNTFRTPGAEPPEVAEWLATEWSRRHPHLPSLPSLLEEGRALLLLDGLNEMPHADGVDYRRRIDRWRHFLQTEVAPRPGNQVVITCRTLDYGQPLSTPELRVPQVRIEPMSDAQIQRFLRAYSPGLAGYLWRNLEGTPHLGMLRSPHVLTMLIAEVAARGEIPRGQAALFTAFIRRTLRREVEAGNPLFAAGLLLSERDHLRIVQATHWPDPWGLPERGPLIPGLSALAFALQARSSMGEHAKLRARHEVATAFVDHPHAEEILHAGVDLNVLEEDPAADEVQFFHHLLQAYFAARKLAALPRSGLDFLQRPWRAEDMEPPLAELLAGLDTADPLPRPRDSGWRETTILAAAMAAEPEVFVSAVAQRHLTLAGRCAARGEVRARLRPAFVERLRDEIVARSTDPAADLRSRIDAGRVVGALGDPRLGAIDGPDGRSLLPPWVAIPAGTYPIGTDQTFLWAGRSFDHGPSHLVTLPAFRIARFPVTNAEWGCFLESGGYEDAQWWEGEAAADWRRGKGTAAGIRAGVRHWRERFRTEPELVEHFRAAGTWSEERGAQWRRWLAMDEADFERSLRETFPGGRLVEPAFWRNRRLSHPSQPVVGICWYEARAYCRWLSAQTGLHVRLPSEVEWEAAARGLTGRLYPYGEIFDPLRGNSVETHVRTTTPIGVFPEGETPEGVSDLAGNVFEWTSTAFGRDEDQEGYLYPYRSDDGREMLDTGPEMRRVVRGGSWNSDATLTTATFRVSNHPDRRMSDDGLRLVVEGV